MIRNSLSWLALSACLAQASVGDWQAWTYTKTPVMATLARGGIWTATSGGAVFYDTLANKAQTYTSLDGLPNTSLVGIHATSDGSVWSISARGDLARLRPNASRWEATGSYRQSGWRFSSRCITSWNDSILLLGSSSGLSLYSIRQGLALDNISSFGTLRQEQVTSILVEKDTIWVGLAHGAAYAVPDWKRIGKAGNLLADPTKWTIIARTESPVRNLFRWFPTTPVIADTTYLDVKNTESSPTISSDIGLYWNQKSWLFSPSYTLAAGKSLVLCLPNDGVKLLRPDGTTKSLQEPMGMPVAIAHHVLFRKSDLLAVWVGASHVIDLPTSLSNMNVRSSSIGIDVGEDMKAHPSFKLNPDGNLLLAPWGIGLLGQESSGWNSWNPNNSCLLSAAGNISYPAITAISNPTSTGNWLGYFDSALSLHLGYLNSATKTLSCFPYDKAGRALGSRIQDLAAEGDSALWVTIEEGVQRYRTQPSLSLDTTFSLLNVRSLLWSNDRLYFAGDANLIGYVARKGKAWSSHKFTGLQAYRKTQLDGLGNLWVSSEHGLDIFYLSDSSMTNMGHIDTSNGLLSNNVYNFALHKETGLAAIITDLGLNLYQSPFKVQPETIDHNLVYPFPNPYRKLLHSNRKVAFPGIRSTSELYIYASDGSLINHQTGKDVVGDQFLWSPKANLRPGIYFWIITDPSSSNIKGRIIVSD